MSDPTEHPQDETAPLEESQAEQSAVLEDGPPAEPKPPTPKPPEGALDINEAQRRCADEIHAACQRYGFQIFTRVLPREVSGGSVLIDATWGLAPIRNH